MERFETGKYHDEYSITTNYLALFEIPANIMVNLRAYTDQYADREFDPFYL
jgi:hypothetical protein